MSQEQNPKTNRDSYGILITPDIKYKRQAFKEAVRLIGIQVIHRAPSKDKDYTLQGELFANYLPPVVVGCVFEEHPTQRTTKKMGWVSELSDESSLIAIPYDTENVQVGSLFIIPSAYDDTQGRVFKVVNMSATMVYPDHITCELVPYYETTTEKEQIDNPNNNTNLLF